MCKKAAGSLTYSQKIETNAFKHMHYKQQNNQQKFYCLL